MVMINSVITYDILQNVRSKLESAIHDFIMKPIEPGKYRYSFVIRLETINDKRYVLRIEQTKDKLVYKVDDDTCAFVAFKTKARKLFNEDVVFCIYEINKTLTIDDVDEYDFIDNVKRELSTISLDVTDKEYYEYLDLDIFRSQTHSKIFLKQEQGKNCFDAKVSYIYDLDENPHLIGVRPALYEDKRFSNNPQNLIPHIKRIMKTFEQYSYTDTFITLNKRFVLLNLKSKTFVSAVEIHDTLEVEQDRRLYTFTFFYKERVRDMANLMNEMMEVSWHPDRFRRWCLTQEEADEINGNFK